jgi:hypothetical protein
MTNTPWWVWVAVALMLLYAGWPVLKDWFPKWRK